jgi:hypothetical protein
MIKTLQFWASMAGDGLTIAVLSILAIAMYYAFARTILEVVRAMQYEKETKDVRERQANCPHIHRHETCSRYGEDDYGYMVTCLDCGKLIDED